MGQGQAAPPSTDSEQPQLRALSPEEESDAVVVPRAVVAAPTTETKQNGSSSTDASKEQAPPAHQAPPPSDVPLSELITPATDDGRPSMRAWVSVRDGDSSSNSSSSSGDANSDFSKIIQLHERVPIPTPSASQARIRVVCASVNPVDVMRAVVGGSGNAAAATNKAAVTTSSKSAGTSNNASVGYVIGTDGAGVVDCFGDAAAGAAAGFTIGDKVLFHLDIASPFGSFAEYTVVGLDVLCHMTSSSSSVRNGSSSISSSSTNGTSASEDAAPPPPAPQPPQPHHQLTFAEAAAMPSAAWTAYVALFDKLKIERGRVLLIDGAAGGVGGYALQFAQMVGTYVIATCSTYNVAFVQQQLGHNPDHGTVIDYVMDDVSDRLRGLTGGQGVDYVLELVGPEQAAGAVRHIRFGGALCQVGGALRTLDAVFFHQQLSLHQVNLNGLHKSPLTAPLLPYIGGQCVAMTESGALRPSVMESVPFEQVRDVMVMLRQGHARGKLVVRVAQPSKVVAAVNSAVTAVAADQERKRGKETPQQQQEEEDMK